MSKFKFGVYYHEKKGFAILDKPSDGDKNEWELDINTQVTVFGLKMLRVCSGVGDYFLEKKLLKGYEYLGWGNDEIK